MGYVNPRNKRILVTVTNTNRRMPSAYVKACYHLLPNQGSLTGSGSTQQSGDGTKTLETIATKAFQLASRNGHVSKEVIYWYQLACPDVDYQRMLGPDSLVQ